MMKTSTQGGRWAVDVVVVVVVVVDDDDDGSCCYDDDDVLKGRNMFCLIGTCDSSLIWCPASLEPNFNNAMQNIDIL